MFEYHFLTRVPAVAGVPAEDLLVAALDSFAQIYRRPYRHVHFERDPEGKLLALWIG